MASASASARRKAGETRESGRLARSGGWVDDAGGEVAGLKEKRGDKTADE